MKGSVIYRNEMDDMSNSVAAMSSMHGIGRYNLHMVNIGMWPMGSAKFPRNHRCRFVTLHKPNQNAVSCIVENVGMRGQIYRRIDIRSNV